MNNDVIEIVHAHIARNNIRLGTRRRLQLRDLQARRIYLALSGEVDIQVGTVTTTEVIPKSDLQSAAFYLLKNCSTGNAV